MEGAQRKIPINMRVVHAVLSGRRDSSLPLAKLSFGNSSYLCFTLLSTQQQLLTSLVQWNVKHGLLESLVQQNQLALPYI